MFMIPESVPARVASAVYRVMHDQATRLDWRCLDEDPRALDHVRRVLEANGTDRMADEMRWWAEQLGPPRERN